MPKPYSEDLRERVLKVVDEKKMSMKAVSEMFSKDMGSFFKFLEDNQNVTTDKVIEKFGNMCKETAYNYLKKAGYTYKKNLSLSRER